MAAPAMVVIIVFMHASVAEGAMWAHGEDQDRRDAAGYMRSRRLHQGESRQRVRLDGIAA
jgi:hypothetical protein